ncbi:MAG TPA: anti-sigma factor, partial [Gaiellaceae bacterium]|nr:anti-sigma factor [Gaiellaceae bacterium]
MTRTPDFDELVNGVEDAAERARLQRVHELLVEAGPPPDLSPGFAAKPPPVEERHNLFRLPRRRLGAALALIGATLVAAFGVGYFAGNSGSDSNEALQIENTIPLTGSGAAGGELGIGARDDDGNLPMLLTVHGLRKLKDGDYYRLALVKNGKPIVTCGTFNVGGRGKTALEML